jgi:hypothetical protein
MIFPMGASFQICQGCILLLATTEAEGRRVESRLGVLRTALEARLGPLRVERHACLLQCGEGTVCLFLKLDGEPRPRCTHLDPANPAEPRWTKR